MDLGYVARLVGVSRSRIGGESGLDGVGADVS